MKSKVTATILFFIALIFSNIQTSFAIGGEDVPGLDHGDMNSS